MSSREAGFATAYITKTIKNFKTKVSETYMKWHTIFMDRGTCYKDDNSPQIDA